MTSWDPKPYWQVADDMAFCAYRSLFSQVKSRGVYYHTQEVPLFLNYENDISETQCCIEYGYQVKSEEKITAPDNLGFCLTASDYPEIEIISMLPKGYRIKKLKNNSSYCFDLLNVIRHEIEHVFQEGEFSLKDINLVDYDRSDQNFMLESKEVPAYVHGFRLSTVSRSNFKKVVRSYINTHGTSLGLTQEEIDKTFNVWLNYLKNLSF
tara:strand:- start:615 stop:1241 length:627 start_codon:yes stop_codon:yes gene_type:complete